MKKYRHGVRQTQGTRWIRELQHFLLRYIEDGFKSHWKKLYQNAIDSGHKASPLEANILPNASKLQWEPWPWAVLFSQSPAHLNFGKQKLPVIQFLTPKITILNPNRPKFLSYLYYIRSLTWPVHRNPGCCNGNWRQTETPTDRPFPR